MFSLRTFSAVAALCATATSQQVNPTISQINGNKFLSPFNGQNVTGVRGLVTAKGPQGFWIRSTTPDSDASTSESIYVFGTEGLANATVGNVVSLNGRVTEFRTNAAYIFLTEIDRPTDITTISTGNAVVPLVIGQGGLNPPTEQFSSLDNGDVFAAPNNQSLISVANPTLDPSQYGIDFWESLSGELVTIRGPRALSRPNSFNDTWVVGEWNTTGENLRGGLTMSDRDANPEAILIGSPLDGTVNPSTTLLGDSLEEITGVVTQGFGFYRILPTTMIRTVSSRSPAVPPPTTLESSGSCDGITVGQYNVENLQPASENLQAIASHIVEYLKTPDLLFLQEVQDNNGAVNDAVVSADITLTTLRDAINTLSSSTNYSFVDLPPVDDQNGGQPGGNIRTAYLYKADRIRLVNGTAGSSTQANEVLPGPSLRYNPGVIDPTNAAWDASRRPLAAHWETVGSEGTFFTFNNHWTSKGGSSSLHGDARPPVNNGITQRVAQAQVLGSFIRSILDADANANVMSAGDYNEFSPVQPLRTFTSVSGLRELDEALGLPETEKYSYLFDMNTQALDHMFVSPRLATSAGSASEHVHVNTWTTVDAQASDHDPSVSRFDVCR